MVRVWTIKHGHFFFPLGIGSKSMLFLGTWTRDTSERSSTHRSLSNHTSGETWDMEDRCARGAVMQNSLFLWEKNLTVAPLVCPFVWQAAHREASASKGQESQLREEKSGQTQGEVSSHESFCHVKFEVSGSYLRCREPDVCQGIRSSTEGGLKPVVCEHVCPAVIWSNKLCYMNRFHTWN